MEKLNFAPFYVGQKVEYITGIKMAKGAICKVYDIYITECGCWAIDINPIPRYKTRESNNIWLCVACGKKYKGNETEKYGWAATSFRPIQEQTFPLLTYKKVLEKELVSAN